MSTLFHDTTRIHLPRRRPSVAKLFSHEAPALGEAKRTRFLSALPRPKDPPPPPPPISAVLKPVIPPKKFNENTGRKSEIGEYSPDEFSSDEFDSVPPEEVQKSDETPVYDEPEFEENKKSEEYSTSSGISTDSNSDESSKKPMRNSKILIDRRPSTNKIVIHTSEAAYKHNESLNLNTSLTSTAAASPCECQKEKVFITSCSWISVSREEKKLKFSPQETLTQEPVKPPRKKKLAKLQKLQKEEEMILTKSKSEEDFSHLKRCSDEGRCQSSKNLRPEISAPILLATTFNPNDAEAHRAVLNNSDPVTTTTTPRETAPTSQR